MLFPIIGAAQKTSDFVLCLTDKIMMKPVSEEDKRKEREDKYNPLSELGSSMLGKIYNSRRALSQRSAKDILSHIDKDRFIDYLQGFSNGVVTSVSDAMREKGIVVFDDKDVYDELANIFESILKKCAEESNKSSNKKIPQLSILENENNSRTEDQAELISDLDNIPRTEDQAELIPNQDNIPRTEDQAELISDLSNIRKLKSPLRK